jgi:hypothetical protein
VDWAQNSKYGPTADFAINTKWSSVVGTGVSVGLAVSRYDSNDVLIGTTDINAVAASDTYTNWYELSGEYEPADVETATVAPTLKVTNATGGNFYFSQGSLFKPLQSDVVPQSWVSGLGDALDAIGEFAQQIGTVIMEVLTGLPFIGWIFSGLKDAFEDFFGDTQVTAGRADDAWLDIGDIIRSITRIFTGVETSDPADADAGLENLNNQVVTAGQDIIDLDGRVTALEGFGVLYTYTVSATWNNPYPSEHRRITIICICGGDGGDRATTGYAAPPSGGNSGGVVEKSFFTDELPATVAMTIGAAGAGATSGGAGGLGGVTSFGSYVTGMKGVGAVYKDGLYKPDIAVPPGNGGNGMVKNSGDNIYYPAHPGESGPFSTGGAAGFGTLSANLTGKNGAAAPSGIPAGGAGGGGGALNSAGTVRGPGGNGGFPGGGGGGGANPVSGTFTDGGNGAAGVIYVAIEGA